MSCIVKFLFTLVFIKEGFCLDNDGRVIYGDILNKENGNYQCSENILNRTYLKLQCLENQCLDERKYTCADMSYVPGVSQRGDCILDLEKTRNLNLLTANSKDCDDDECYDIEEESCKLMINIYNSPIKNGDCLDAGTPTLDLLKCLEGYCKKNMGDRQLACFLIDGSPGQFGIDVYQNCLGEKQSGAVKCSNKSDKVCFDPKNQQCLGNTNENVSGIDQNGNCLEANKDTLNMKMCYENYCIKKGLFFSGCFLMDGSQGQFGKDKNGKCLDADETGAIKELIKMEIVWKLINIFKVIIQNEKGDFQFLYYQDLKICYENYCIKKDKDKTQLSGCFLMDGSQGQFGIDKNGNCLDADETGAIKELIKMDNVWKLMNSLLGIYVDGNCIKRDQQVQRSNIKKCENYHCIALDDTKTKAQCSFIDGSRYAGIDDEGLCLGFEQATAKQCPSLNNEICFDQVKKYCTSTKTFGGNQGCHLKGICQPLSISQYIGRDINLSCLEKQKDSQNVNVDQCIDDSDQVCLDQEKQLCAIYPESQVYLGYVIDNKNCAILNQFAYKENQIANILSCSFNHCKVKEIPNDPNSKEGCFEFDASQRRVGINSEGYCVQEDEENAERQFLINFINQNTFFFVNSCMKGQFCLKNDPNKTCQSLSKEKNFFARQKNSGLCLPFLEKNSQGDVIETCVKGTCLYKNTDTSQYCFEENTNFNGYLIVGTYINGDCVIKDQQSTTWRSQQNQECLPKEQTIAIKCAQGYCIQKGGCIPLSDLIPGKEKETDNCLPEKIESQKGIDSCYKQGQISLLLIIINIKFNIKSYCIMNNSTSNLQACYKLDFNNPKAIGMHNFFLQKNLQAIFINIKGREEGTQNCIPENQPKAIIDVWIALRIMGYENSEQVLNYYPEQLRVLTQSQDNYINKFIKKCTKCKEGFFLSYNGEDCEGTILNCQEFTFIINGISNLSQNITQFVPRNKESSFKIEKLCQRCNQDFYHENLECQSISQNSLCQKQIDLCQRCLIQSNDNQNSCQFCYKGHVLSIQENSHNCQSDICFWVF
ncbi:hypothetical protein ABPG73_004612 [Tetrahymena malaccensis]